MRPISKLNEIHEKADIIKNTISTKNENGENRGIFSLTKEKILQQNNSKNKQEFERLLLWALWVHRLENLFSNSIVGSLRVIIFQKEGAIHRCGKFDHFGTI